MLSALIASPSVRAESGRKARRVLASYDWDKITGQIEDEYLRITGQPAPATNIPKPVAGATKPTMHDRAA